MPFRDGEIYIGPATDMFSVIGMANDDPEKLDRGALPALMSLPPFPVFLLVVGEKDPDVSTIGLFNVFSVDKPRVGVAVKSSRWTYKLLEETPDFTLNIPGKDLVDKVIKIGEVSGSKMNKFAEVGLTPKPGTRTRSPTIQECPLNLEVEKQEIIDRSDWDHIWVIGKIVHCDIHPDYDRGNMLLYWDGEFRTASKVIRKME